MSVETQWNHMFWRVTEQTTLKDKDAASDDRVDVKQSLEPKDGYSKNIFQRDQTQW